MGHIVSTTFIIIIAVRFETKKLIQDAKRLDYNLSIDRKLGGVEQIII